MSEKSEGQDKSKPTKPSSTEPSDSTAGMSMEHLRRYLAEKLGFYDDEEQEREEEKIKVLDDVSVDGIIDYIKAKNCRNIITMAGAGISTSAGIPDFRSPGTGLYHNLQKYKLPHPQAIFELDFFRRKPKTIFRTSQRIISG
ncbi:hypothetical protein NQ317_011428 [Molorchus minor]|uniref:Deacetylase sirtuin-type domain-containing protein n=1 Tax=Molorchus minor TaxID=1323400 RepID=A0ABQ9JRG3_9CUCU|nr:hypothetical protein NQ317_011428 [Molorchus minor]